MKPLISKIFFTVCASILIVFLALPWGHWGFNIPFSGPDYKLGLDLQ